MLAIAHPLATASSHTAPPLHNQPLDLAPWALVGALALVALACHTLVWNTLPTLVAAHATPHAEAQAAPQTATQALPAQPAVAADLIAALRQAAGLGNMEASVMLVGALLDRYDAGAGAGALVEALQWMERDLDTVPMLASPQVQRVVLGPCTHDPLLQWHWLCNQGE